MTVGVVQGSRRRRASSHLHVLQLREGDPARDARGGRDRPSAAALASDGPHSYAFFFDLPHCPICFQRRSS